MADNPRHVILCEIRSGCSASDVQDAEWAPFSEAERQASGVSIGSGLSCTSELAEAGSFVLQGLVRKCAPCLPLALLYAPCHAVLGHASWPSPCAAQA